MKFMDRSSDDLEYIRRLYEDRVVSAVPFYMEAADLADLVEWYEKAGLDHEAEACLRYALRLHPDDFDLLLTKAYRLKNYGRWSEALELVRSLADQNLREVKMFYFENMLNEMRPDEAEAYLEQEFFSDKGGQVDYDVYVEAAELYLDYNFPDRALHALRHVPAGFGDAKQKAELEADAYAGKSDFSQAEAVMNASLDADPYDDISWTQLADIQYKAHKFSAAFDSSNYALAINPDSDQALRVRACAAAEGNDIADYGRYADEYLAKFPDDYYVRLLLGERYYADGRYDDAAKALQQAYRACPQDAADKQRILSGLVYTYAHQGRVALAFESFAAGFATPPSPFEATYQIASIVFDIGRKTDAVRLLDQYLDVHPLNGQEVMRLSALLCKYGCYEPAGTVWVVLLAPHKDVPPMAQPWLAYGAYRMGLHRDALRRLREAVVTSPDETYGLFSEAFPGHGVTDFPVLLERMLREQGDA